MLYILLKPWVDETFPFSLSTVWVWLHVYPNILSTLAFWQALLWPWIIQRSALPPGRHNHTCLILSNLSFTPANQLLCCALFPPLARLWLKHTLFYAPPTPPPPAPNPPFFSIFIFFCFFPRYGIRVNLDPSKRQGSNKSVSGCTLPQGSKTVSKFPCLSLLSCLPVLPPSVWLLLLEWTPFSPVPDCCVHGLCLFVTLARCQHTWFSAWA